MGNTANASDMLGITDIMEIIPHRYPFLLIDKARTVEADKRIIGYKSVTGNEWFFQQNFSGQPIMPGILIVEAMAQTAGILMMNKPAMKNKLVFFLGMNGVKFRKPVSPGDQLELRVEILHYNMRGGKARGEAYVNNELTTEAELAFVVVDKQDKA